MPDIDGINISNPEKILFPEDNISKLDIISYYDKISPYMLPYLKNRPLVMQRYPDGIYGEAFYQKNTPDYFPDWIKTIDVAKKEGGITKYVICQNRETLIYLANLASLTFHLWLSNIKNLEIPDRLIFDLDPSPEIDFNVVIEVAQKFRKMLVDLGLNPFLMTTGSKGLHVVIPLKPKFNYEQVQLFAYGCAYILFHKEPKLVTLEISKIKRKGKVFIDTLRNQFGSLAVAPYSVRAKPKAPVATPIDWQELESKSFNSQKYNINNIFDKLKKKDPWENFFEYQASLIKPHKKLVKILE